MAAAPSSVHKSEEEWRAILSPEQFRILREKGTEPRGTGSTTNFMRMGYITALVVEPHCINPQPNLTRVAVGLLFSRVSLEPLTALQIQTVGGLKSHVLLVVDIKVMYSKVKDSKHLQTKDTASTAFQSSSSLWNPRLPCEVFPRSHGA